ncbi:hypothetical protein HDV02_002202 [Globomyces sp. JEL0801]|nr:hypothetical protein HDV02_002202 [Globomyces sp. JEL0801]
MKKHFHRLSINRSTGISITQMLSTAIFGLFAAFVASTPVTSPVNAVTATPQFSQFPWELVQAANQSANSITSKPALIGPNSDIIAFPLGYSIMHYNITSKKSITYEGFDTVVTIFAVPGSNIAWAGGSPTDQFENNIGRLWQFDFSAATPKWNVVLLPFPLRYVIRDFHGTDDNNIWATSGAGGVEPRTGSLIQFNGKKWIKHLDGVDTVIAVFTRGSHVWASLGDGSLFHTTTGFGNANQLEVVLPKRRNFGVGPFWGNQKPGAPLYFLSTDGLHRITNPDCTPTKKPFCFFGNCVKPCQIVQNLYQLPNADTLDSMIALTGDLPGTTSDMVYVVGGGAWGGLWNGQKLIQDKSMIYTNESQSTYLSVFAKDNYLYGVSTATFIAKKRLF